MMSLTIILILIKWTYMSASHCALHSARARHGGLGELASVTTTAV